MTGVGDGSLPDVGGPDERSPAVGGPIVSAEVDARGLKCPLPILRTKKALAAVASGDVLRVLATDPGSRRDFEAFARQTGNELIEAREDDGVFTFLMRRR